MDWNNFKNACGTCTRDSGPVTAKKWGFRLFWGIWGMGHIWVENDVFGCLEGFRGRSEPRRVILSKKQKIGSGVTFDPPMPIMGPIGTPLVYVLGCP